MRALLSAQRRERTPFDLAAACAANYEAIDELKISYDTLTAETPAAVLYERYRTLQSLNRSLCDSLNGCGARSTTTRTTPTPT